MENRLLFYTLTFSLSVHFLAVIYLALSHPQFLKKPFRAMEVTYQNLKVKEVKKDAPPTRELKIAAAKKIENDVKLLPKKLSTTTSFDKYIKEVSQIKGAGDLAFEKKQAPHINTLDVNQKITIPLLKSDKISNPKYLSYNQSIRQKIKQRAYGYVSNQTFKTGQVYLTFVLASDGTLKQVKIIDSKTNAGDFLKNIGLRSIQESNPFPPFPKDLNYPELTFNVIISFEVSE